MKHETWKKQDGMYGGLTKHVFDVAKIKGKIKKRLTVRWKRISISWNVLNVNFWVMRFKIIERATKFCCWLYILFIDEKREEKTWEFLPSFIEKQMFWYGKENYKNWN